MTRVLAVVLAACLAAGCAFLKKGETGGAASSAGATKPAAPAKSGKTGKPDQPGGGSFLERYAGSRRLAHAVEMLGQGNQSGAMKELNAICNDAPMAGVTDEALFRLALLSLKPTQDKPASPQAQQLLKRLRKEYPASSWAIQAAPLIELLEVADDLKQQNRSLKANNQSLSREINDLNKTIKQLKNLDLELEQKSR